MNHKHHGTIFSLLILLTFTGCATRKGMRTHVASETSTLDQRIDGVTSQVEQNQTRIDQHDQRLVDQERGLDAASDTAREALERAVAAGKLAEGKLLYETVLSDDAVRFGFDRVELSSEAKAALDAFAEELKVANQNVFVEIQGHTDATGPDDYNLKLGEQRAEATRRYLNREHALPLHRMSVISYGESAPLVDNGGREARASNRRVALVVLR